MLIPGYIIALITFPGVIIHEFAHAAFCRVTGTQVFKVCYFRVGDPAGYVLHAIPTNLWKHLLIAVGPFIINSSVGIALGALANSLHLGDARFDGISAPFYWLAISIAMHAFPSTGDAKSIWHAISQEGAPTLARLVGTPLVAIIVVGAFGSVFWLHALYGAWLVCDVPKLLF